MGPARELDVRTAADLIGRLSAEATGLRGRFHVVVPGGRGLVPLIGPLSERGLPGPDWTMHLSDERSVPRGHPDRNIDAVARLLSITVSAVPSARRAPRLVGPPDDDRGLPSAEGWTSELAAAPDFDLVILGVGSDGHVAGLFPDDGAGMMPGAPDAVMVAPGRGLPHARVTMSAARLSRGRALLLVAVGAGKEAVVARLRGGQDTDGPTGRIRIDPRHLLVVSEIEAMSRKSARV